MMVSGECTAEMDSWLGNPSWETGQDVQILGQHNGWKQKSTKRHEWKQSTATIKKNIKKWRKKSHDSSE